MPSYTGIGSETREPGRLAQSNEPAVWTLLVKIVEVNQRMLDRRIELKKECDGAEAQDDIDQYELNLFQAQLELAKYENENKWGGLPAQDPFFTVSLLQIIKKEAIEKVVMNKDGKEEKAVTGYKLELKIDKKLPIDTGRIELSVPTKPGDDPKTPQTTAVFEIVVENRQRPGDRPTFVSDRVIVVFPIVQDPDTLRTSLASSPMTAKIFLRHHRPQPPTPNNALYRIDFP
jgi:hypothetical protein